MTNANSDLANAVELSPQSFATLTASSETKNTTLACFKDVSNEWETNGSRFLHARITYGATNAERVFLAVTGDKNTPDASNMTEYHLKAPQLLKTVEIPKPWGKEVWFTGIEERGVCSVSQIPESSQSKATSFLLSDLIKLFGSDFIDEESGQPILLKILAPNDSQRSGNLYYELHTEKQEVYIVSDVSKKWETGTGKMKYGINPEKLNSYSCEQEFKDDFKKHVKTYEAIRKQVETELDKLRLEHNIGLKDPISPEKLDEFYATIDPGLVASEQEAKDKLETFVGWKEIKRGDVISVETHVPHSLQHGIEVIEFQTPVYERFIVSFDQKVLTQDQWDIDEAFKVMNCTAPSEQPLRVIESSDISKVEEVVNFSGFYVHKITVNDSHCLKDSNQHAIVYVIEGSIELQSEQGSFTLSEGKAYYIPLQSGDYKLVRKTQETPSLLLARPSTNP